ncbi:MAG: hypothetical protein JWM06_1246 [Actinomycetia bacterium]|nr:hypothetical protein [Actinomycetes bacterium]
MARQKPADAAKAKAAKQKKIAIALCCVLALAMAYAVHTMMALNGSGGSKPVAAPLSTSGGAPVATPTNGAPAASAAAPSLSGSLAVAPAAPAATDTSKLISAVKPSAGAGQLESFSRFESKDPFAGGAPAGSSSGGSSPASGKGSSGTGTPSAPAVPPAPPSPPPSSAVIAVNATPESVSSGANFPAANPNASANGVFNLRSLTATTATIAIVGGSYASGSQTITLHVNKPVTLVNTADGTRYTLMLNPQGTVAPAGASGSSSSGSSTVPSTPVVPSTPGG